MDQCHLGWDLFFAYEFKFHVGTFSGPRMVPLFLNRTTHVTLFYLTSWSPSSEFYNKILNPEPEAEGAGVAKAHPHKGSAGIVGLQLSPGLGLFVNNGSQGLVMAPAVVQRIGPCLLLHDQLKRGFSKKRKKKKIRNWINAHEIKG